MTEARTEAARALALARWGEREPRACAECGAQVPPESRYRTYCSGRCQVRALRRAKREAKR